MFRRVPTNEIEVVVSPNEKTITGIFKGFGEDLNSKEKYNLAQQVKKDIERHVNDAENVWITQKHLWEDENGEQYDSLYDAIEEKFAESYFKYEIRYVRPSDKGIGTRTYPKTFRDLIVSAYENPWEFEVIKANPSLNDEQKVFLARVIAESQWQSESLKGTKETA